jgi:uncharacterized protein (TIGR03435 family)
VPIPIISIRVYLRAFAAVFVVATAAAQTFEAASVKPHPLPSGQFMVRRANRPDPDGFRITGNRVTATGNLRGLICDAYQVKDYQVTGLPDWGSAGDTIFDIDARTMEESTKPSEVRVMLQALLAERFRLKLHRDKRDLPVYELVVGRSANKLNEVSAADHQTFLQGKNVGAASPDMLTAAQSTLLTLVNLLSNAADRPIINKTGLNPAAFFQYENLDWAQLARNKRGEGDPGVSVFTEVQEKLGLKLEPAKAATDVLMIDHAERLSAN